MLPKELSQENSLHDLLRKTASCRVTEYTIGFVGMMLCLKGRCFPLACF